MRIFKNIVFVLGIIWFGYFTLESTGYPGLMFDNVDKAKFFLGITLLCVWFFAMTSNALFIALLASILMHFTFIILKINEPDALRIIGAIVLVSLVSLLFYRPNSS